MNQKVLSIVDTVSMVGNEVAYQESVLAITNFFLRMRYQNTILAHSVSNRTLHKSSNNEQYKSGRAHSYVVLSVKAILLSHF